MTKKGSPDEGGPPPAHEVALRILTAAAQSQASLTDKLSRRGYEPQEISETVAWLVEHGYVDDEKLARGYIAKRRTRGYGDTRIVAELRQRGIPNELASALVWPTDSILEREEEEGASGEDHEGEIERCVRQLRPYFDPETMGVSDAAVRRMQRRGFGTSTILRAIDQLRSSATL